MTAQPDKIPAPPAPWPPPTDPARPRRPAHRPARPRPWRTPTQLNAALYSLAGHWELAASVAERSIQLGRVEREATAAQLRKCSDQLLAILDGTA